MALRDLDRPSHDVALVPSAAGGVRDARKEGSRQGTRRPMNLEGGHELRTGGESEG
jgi:hypothetical protein